MALRSARRGPVPRRAPARRHGAEAGQAAVELALVVPLVVVIVLAIVQVGLVVRDQVLVIHAAREAARVVAVHGDAGVALPAAGDAGGLHPDRVKVVVSGSLGEGKRVRVRVTYAAPTDVPLIGALVGDVQLHGTATMRVER